MSNVKPYQQKTDHETKRVLVGLSGGVHSAVTAALLKTQGHEVVGVHVETHASEKLTRMSSRCCKAGSRAAAEKVASKLGIDLHFVDATALFETQVTEYLIHETMAGRMPSPCHACYREVHIQWLLSKAPELRCELVATGHGAQLIHDPRTGKSHLLRGSDTQRDQSYYLFTLKPADLGRLLMPLGNFPSAMVSRLASEYGFGDIMPGENPETCFIESPEYSAFIESRTPASLRPGSVVKSYENQVLGDHAGLQRFRIGTKPALSSVSKEIEDFVVLKTDTRTHTLVIGTPEKLMGQECTVTQVSWLGPQDQLHGLSCIARSGPSEALMFPCQLTFFENNTALVQFEQPRGPLIPGQAMVFYLDNEVLGGGWIGK